MTEVIKLPRGRRERSIQLVKAVKNAADAKVAYLFDGLCQNAADALFEEQFDSTDAEALTRQFNITRALKVESDTLLEQFRSHLGYAWVNLLNKKDAPGLSLPEDEVAELLLRYSERHRVHYKLLLEELRQRFCLLAGAELTHHPLLPLNFFVSFWHASEVLNLTLEERRLLLVLFHRFVMDRYGQVMAVANQTLRERGLNPVAVR